MRGTSGTARPPRVWQLATRLARRVPTSCASLLRPQTGAPLRPRKTSLCRRPLPQARSRPLSHSPHRARPQARPSSSTGPGRPAPRALPRMRGTFGDGTTTTASGVTIPHTFSAAGAFVVRLTVTATDGSTATTTRNLVVTATAPAPSAPPVANFSFSPLAPAVDDLVSFDASSSSAAAGRTIASYAWTFGDNTSVTSVTPTTTHTYTPSGVYTVVLTVTDDVGNTSTTAKSVNVGSPPQPTAAFQTSIGAAGHVHILRCQDVNHPGGSDDCPLRVELRGRHRHIHMRPRHRRRNWSRCE